MTLLDENIPDGIRLGMEALGMTVRQIGFEWGRKGMSDVWLRYDRGVDLRSSPKMRTSSRKCTAPELLHCVTGRTGGRNGTVRDRYLKHKRFRTFGLRGGMVARLQPDGDCVLATWDAGPTER